ncbi:11742_t:CDS:2, partial [Cetraspora pellucida]
VDFPFTDDNEEKVKKRGNYVIDLSTLTAYHDIEMIEQLDEIKFLIEAIDRENKLKMVKRERRTFDYGPFTREFISILHERGEMKMRYFVSEINSYLSQPPQRGVSRRLRRQTPTHFSSTGTSRGSVPGFGRSSRDPVHKIHQQYDEETTDEKEAAKHQGDEKEAAKHQSDEK